MSKVEKVCEVSMRLRRKLVRVEGRKRREEKRRQNRKRGTKR